MNLHRGIATGIALASLMSLPAMTGGDKIAFPENYDRGVLYAIVATVAAAPSC